MMEQTFDATADPMEIADRLGLEVLQRVGGEIYAREKSNPNSALFSIGPVKPEDSEGGSADLRVRVAEVWSYDGYVGEEYHTPREGAVHAGLTVIEETDSGKVLALDGFGRKFVVDKTGNGPMASWIGWATEEDMRKWAPQHRPAKRTNT